MKSITNKTNTEYSICFYFISLNTDFGDLFEELFSNKLNYTTTDLLNDLDHIKNRHLNNKSECLRFGECSHQQRTWIMCK